MSHNITPYTSTGSKLSTSSTSSTSSMKSIGKKVGKFMKSLIEPPTDECNLGYHSPVKRGLVPASNLGTYALEMARRA